MFCFRYRSSVARTSVTCHPKCQNAVCGCVAGGAATLLNSTHTLFGDRNAGCPANVPFDVDRERFDVKLDRRFRIDRVEMEMMERRSWQRRLGREARARKPEARQARRARRLVFEPERPPNASVDVRAEHRIVRTRCRRDGQVTCRTFGPCRIPASTPADNRRRVSGSVASTCPCARCRG